MKPNLRLIGVYGRYDDWYSLIGTPLEDDMWDAMKKQLDFDLSCYDKDINVPISLLAKWLKTADASSLNTRKLGILTAQKLGYSVYDYKRIVRKLRKRIVITESLMSANEWGNIEYSKVPSRSMLKHKEAFNKHDEARYQDYINQAVKGDIKINSSTLYPYDLIEKIY